MEFKNAQYNKFGTIDCDINHPVYGWVPFTASPDDVEPLGAEIHQAALDAGGVAAYVEPPPPTAEELRPSMVVSRFQARVALHNAGMLADVQVLMGDPATDPVAVIAWQDAQEFRRLSPTIVAMGAALGWTETQLDELFVAAALIDA